MPGVLQSTLFWPSWILFNFHFNIIIVPTPRFLKWSLPWMFRCKNYVHISNLPNAYYVFCLSHPPILVALVICSAEYKLRSSSLCNCSCYHETVCSFSQELFSCASSCEVSTDPNQTVTAAVDAFQSIQHWARAKRPRTAVIVITQWAAEP